MELCKDVLCIHCVHHFLPVDTFVDIDQTGNPYHHSNYYSNTASGKYLPYINRVCLLFHHNSFAIPLTYV